VVYPTNPFDMLARLASAGFNKFPASAFLSAFILLHLRSSAITISALVSLSV
jgi:hypothetical protein